MARNPTFPADHARVFLVLEVSVNSTAKLGRVTVTASVPGRDSTINYHWKAPYGILDEKQLNDMAARITKLTVDGAIAFTGAQRSLDM